MMKHTKEPVDVLGTPYLISTGNTIDFPALEECNGYCDDSVKVIVAFDPDAKDNERLGKKDLRRCQRKTVRHELVHAFLFESGLSANSWAENEEIVDWIAVQFGKLHRAFVAAGCYEEGD